MIEHKFGFSPSTAGQLHQHKIPLKPVAALAPVQVQVPVQLLRMRIGFVNADVATPINAHYQELACVIVCAFAVRFLSRNICAKDG